jgi:hypothetical protein
MPKPYRAGLLTVAEVGLHNFCSTSQQKRFVLAQVTQQCHAQTHSHPHMAAAV